MASRFAFARLRDLPLDSETAATRQAILIPALLAACMLLVGFTTVRMAGIDNSHLFVPYIVVAGAITFVSAMLYIFIAFAKLARKLADNPCKLVWQDVRKRGPMLLLPVLIFPLFLSGYTSAKTAISFLVGYSWDGFWTNVDVLIFGDDAWRIAHAWLGTDKAWLWEIFYSTAWGAGLLLFKANVALYASPRRAGVIFTAMMLTWLIGGWFMAYTMSAAGPIFAHLVDADLGARFAPLRSEMNVLLASDSGIRLTQDYLAQAINATVAVKGGGISAMPSMHIGAVSIFVLSARGTRWLVPAIIFWIIIFIGSAYFGYHYWIDGIVAALVAWGAWKFAEALFRNDQPSGLPDHSGQRSFAAVLTLPMLFRPTLVGARTGTRDSEQSGR